MPGILDGRLRDDEGLRAGRTSSPDFLRSMGGFLWESSSSLSSSSDVEFGVSVSRLRSIKTAESVFDREWAILRCPWDSARSTWSIVGFKAASSEGITNVRTAFAFATSWALRTGELERCCSITLMAACSSARLDNCRPRIFSASSSSLEFWVDSGGERTAPDGIRASSVIGGGDCLRLPFVLRAFESSFSLSAVPGGVGSSVVEAKDVVLTDCVRRCRVRYEVDRGSSGLLEDDGENPSEELLACDDRRLRLGEELAEAAGDLWLGGV